MATGGIPEVSASSNNGAMEMALLSLTQVVQTLQQQQLTLGKTVEELSVKVAWVSLHREIHRLRLKVRSYQDALYQHRCLPNNL